jgi:hypothetical protein
MLNRLATVTAALVVLGASSVCAQPAPDRGDGARPPALSLEDAGAYLEARISALHSGLQLTPEQERLWPAFEQAYRESAKLRLERGSEPPSADDPVARMQRRADALTRRAAAAKALAEAAAPLWQSFGDGQKRRFAALARPSVPATSAAVSAATASATVLAVGHGISDRANAGVTGILSPAGSGSGAPAATAITIAGHGIRGRNVVTATEMVMGLGGSGSLSRGASVVPAATAIMAMASGGALDRAATAITATASDGTSNGAASDPTAIMAMAGGGALDPAGTAITTTASDEASNGAASDAATIMATVSGRALDPTVPITATDVISVAALVATSAAPTAAAACHGGTRTS